MKILSNIYWFFWRMVHLHAHPIGCIQNWYYRITKGVGQWDVMDYNTWLAGKIVKHLRFYKERNVGFPNEFVWDDEDWDEGQILWDAILDKMIHSFDLIVREGEIEDEWYEDYPESMDWESLEELNKPISQEVKSWYKEKYAPRREEYERQVQEGLNLFAKYFRNLWF